MNAEKSVAIRLPARTVIEISGEDRAKFLQGLISNDIGKIDKGDAIYAALLTPQGKYLFDFFIVDQGEGQGDVFLLDCEAARAEAFIQRLAMYRLRAKVEIIDRSVELSVWAIMDSDVEPAIDPGGVIYRDPRLNALGYRAILPTGVEPGFAVATPEDYDRHRLQLGVPDASRDIEPDRRLMLEANFGELNGVDFEKGCYVGQENAARMKYRGKIRKRLIPVEFEGSAPTPGTPILQNGRNVGEFRSGREGRAIALLRPEDFAKGPFTTEDGTEVTPDVPDWLASSLETGLDEDLT